MNREIAKSKLVGTFRNIPFSELKIGDINNLIDKIYDDFEKDLKDINNQLSRLKKQLSKGHHIECGCSFCKPVGEKQSCENCKHYDGTQTCNKFVARSAYDYKDFYCNKWELKC